MVAFLLTKLCCKELIFTKFVLSFEFWEQSNCVCLEFRAITVFSAWGNISMT